MIIFWIAAAGLLAAALALLLPALARQHPAGPAAPSSTQTNVQILRDQLSQLDAELASGAITAAQHQVARGEIEQRVLDEEAGSGQPDVVAAPSRKTAWALGLLVPLFAVGLYGLVGNLQALAPQPPVASERDVEALVSKMAERLESQPDDVLGWTLLARSYAAMQRFPESSKAYRRAIALNPKDAQLLADLADVLAMIQGRSAEGEPTRLVEKALLLEPNNLKALALAGGAAFDRNDFAAAQGYWSKARQLAPPDSDFAKGLDRGIAEARAAAANPGSPIIASAAAAPAPVQLAASSAPAAAAAAATAAKGDTSSASAGGGISGRVSLAPTLAARVAPTDTVFIFARAAEGPRMPLAILKRNVSDLPIRFTLDDSMAMSPELKLSKFPSVVVGARVSKSGNAMPQPGDLVGQSAPLTAGSAGLELVIERVQP